MVNRRLAVGDWKIIESEGWDKPALDLTGPALLSLEPSGMGSMGFIAISGGIDYRRTYRDGKPSVEFSWEGIDEGDPRCNRGWPVLAGDTMHGRLFIHASDDSALRSVRVS